jgi:type I restriction enzyme, S subunit
MKLLHGVKRSWPTASLGELLRLERRPVRTEPAKLYQEIGIYCFGRGIFYKTPRSGLEVGNKKLFLLKEGDFILQVTFAWEGAVALLSAAEDGMYGSTRYPTFRVDESRCFPKFLLYYFKTEEGLQQLVKISPGSAGRNRVLSLKRIPEVIVPLPPLAEQPRVVARIEQLAAQIQEARGLRQQAAEEAEALVSSALRPLAEHANPTGQLRDVLSGAPRNGWSAKCDNADGGTPVLSLGAVTGFRYRRKEFKRTSMPASKEGHFWLRPGDLLISRSNTPELVGHAAMYDGQPAPCIYPDLMMRLDLNKNLVNPRFVWYWLQAPPTREFITRHAKGTSPTMKKISQGTVMDIPFPSSLPLADQRRIVAELDALQAEVDALNCLQTETAAELSALLPAILDRAFRGEI